MPDSPHTADIVERLERQLSTCSDSFEAPSGKIMLRVWCNDMAAILKLARAADPEATAEIKALREALEEAETPNPSPDTGLIEALKLARPYVEANADRGSRMAAHHRGADVLEIIDAALANAAPAQVEIKER